jgi:uncharacterized protein with beta-barrel porin domain
MSKGRSKKACCHSVWAAAFGALVDQEQESNSPEMDSSIAGGMLGVDFTGLCNINFGAGIAYAFNDVDYGHNEGDASINQELLTLYGSWSRRNFFVNVSLWGGIYQLENHRNTLSLATIRSTGKTDGWLLVPHLELGAPFRMGCGWLMVDPFVMLDWANNWQDGFTETGSSGLNVVLDNEYVSMLRTEVGLRLFERAKYNCGCIVFEEKVSYVNKTPFNAGSVSTFFVGANSTFGVETFSSKSQNLVAAQLNLRFMPKNSRLPNVALNYQGEFVSTFVSNLLSLELGKQF